MLGIGMLVPSLMLTGGPVFSRIRSMVGMTLFRCPVLVSCTRWFTGCWILADRSWYLLGKSSKNW